MRKISIAMTTILMAVLMCLSTLLGCGLVTTNYDRDMKHINTAINIVVIAIEIFLIYNSHFK